MLIIVCVWAQNQPVWLSGPAEDKSLHSLRQKDDFTMVGKLTTNPFTSETPENNWKKKVYIFFRDILKSFKSYTYHGNCSSYYTVRKRNCFSTRTWTIRSGDICGCVIYLLFKFWMSYRDISFGILRIYDCQVSTPRCFIN